MTDYLVPIHKNPAIRAALLQPIVVTDGDGRVDAVIPKPQTYLVCDSCNAVVDIYDRGDDTLYGYALTDGATISHVLCERCREKDGFNTLEIRNEQGAGDEPPPSGFEARLKCPTCGESRFRRAVTDVVRIYRSKEGDRDDFTGTDDDYRYSCLSCDVSVDVERLVRAGTALRGRDGVLS